MTTDDLSVIAGMRPAVATIRPNLELAAVELVVPDAGVEMVLSQSAALEMVLRTIGSLAELQGWAEGPPTSPQMHERQRAPGA